MNSLSLLNCCAPLIRGFAHNFGTLDAVLKEGGFIPLVTLEDAPFKDLTTFWILVLPATAILDYTS